jgi:sterol 14-demethylase
LTALRRFVAGRLWVGVRQQIKSKQAERSRAPTAARLWIFKSRQRVSLSQQWLEETMLPPRLPGRPLIGNMVEFRRDPVACIRGGYRRLGPLFTLRLGPKRVVIMIGPRFHRLFYKETDKALSTPEVYRFLTPMFGQVLGACPFHEYKEQRHAIAPFFAKQFMSKHIGIMAQETQNLVRSMDAAGEIELWDAIEHLALTVAAKAVLGADFWAIPGVNFRAMFCDIARGMDYILPPNLPLPRFIRRNKARKRLYALIEPLVLQRRQRNETYDDLFQSIALAAYSNGTALPAETVTGLILIMIHGAYETVAAQACWCLIDLINRPDVLRHVLAEQREALPGAAATITAAALARMPRLNSVVNESARLHPAATVVCRYAAKPLQIDQYTIPAGSLVMICPGVAHRLPEVFPNPDAFIADRFLDADFDNNEYITFGGGPHGCLGYDFAIAEIMVIAATLLRRFDLKLKTPNPEPNYDMAVTRPAPPCSVQYELREPLEEATPQVFERAAAY